MELLHGKKLHYHSRQPPIVTVLYLQTWSWPDPEGEAPAWTPPPHRAPPPGFLPSHGWRPAAHVRPPTRETRACRTALPPWRGRRRDSGSCSPGNYTGLRPPSCWLLSVFTTRARKRVETTLKSYVRTPHVDAAVTCKYGVQTVPTPSHFFIFTAC